MSVNSADMIVVSGAGTGIGRAVSRRLVADGFHVLAVGRRPEPLDRLAKELAPRLDAVSADLSTVAGATAVAECARAAERRCGGIVAAAGGLSPGGEGATGLDGVRQDWLASFESNVLTAVLLVEALREALERDGSRVVLLSSVAALRGSGGGAYGAVKAALHGYVYDLARKLGPHGGTANVVAPGFVPDTEFWDGRLTGESRRERAAETLVGREGTPEEVASLISWLLGPEGGWVTGQVLSPNGGVVLGR
jgi:3-oxoacyl-[acyl-carrier protein] reductase